MSQVTAAAICAWPMSNVFDRDGEGFRNRITKVDGFRKFA